MSQFDARHLINNLPLFDQNLASSEEITAYRKYYQIDFCEQNCDQNLGILKAAGYNIAIHRFEPKQSLGQAIIVHGYHDHHGLYGHLVKYLLSRKLTVTCFDLPGHGLSSGERGTIADFEQYQEIFAAVLATIPKDQPCHWIGQSTGAAIINHYLLRQRPKINGQIILFAPLVRPAQWQLVKLAHNLVKPWVDSVQRRFAENSNDPVFLKFLKELDPLQSRTITVQWVAALKRWIPQFLNLPSSSDYRPLIIQGQQDDTVDWRYNLNVLEQKFPCSKVLLLDRGRHHLVNDSEEIRQQFFDWIDKQWH